MSLLTIIGLVIAALVGMFVGHPLSKASGRKEGAKEAKQEQQVYQAQAITQSVQERNDAETKVAATPRSALDDELREFSRPD